MKRCLPFFMALALVFLAIPLISGADAGAEVADLYRVRCAGCHGLGGSSIASYIPDIGGQKEEYLATQLKDFRAGLRTGSAMPPVVRRMSDDEIKALAGYIASLNKCSI